MVGVRQIILQRRKKIENIYVNTQNVIWKYKNATLDQMQNSSFLQKQIFYVIK